MKKKTWLLCVVWSVVSLEASAASKPEVPLYKNSKAPTAARVADLMSRMTLEEKIAQLQNRAVYRGFEDMMKGMSYGTVHEMNLPAAECAQLYDRLQNYLRTETRLGIPALTCAEGISGVLQEGCTIFPHELAQGSTFNPALIQKMTDAAGGEAVAIGIHQILSPVLDLARELRWGRVEETFGEDPYLAAVMGTAFVKGYQQHAITCTPKHFIAHGSPSGGLNTAGVYGGPRDLWSTYLYPFRRVIAEARPKSVMTCYSAYDGVAITGSHYYMTEVLRDSLGFDGYVYSDWGSIERLQTVHHSVATPEEAARKALLAGVDLNVDPTYETLAGQVREGKITEEDIDRALRRILTTKFELGLFDEASEGKGKKAKADKTAVVHNDDNVRLSKQVADESAILLKNDNDILPLNLDHTKRIAVIGPNSNQAVYGDYSWTTGDTKVGINLLQGLQQAVAGKAEIVYAEGCDWWSRDESKIAEAVEAARRSDVAVVAIGTRSTYLARSPKNVTSGEGFDLSSLELPGVQQKLLEAVKATGVPMVVVFISGRPLAMPWVKENADALIVQWYAGERQGESMADILLGKVNPSGRLNVSFPRSSGNIPCFYNYNTNDRESVFDRAGTPDNPGYHYVFDAPQPLWHFGEGLSYTRFEYEDCQLSDTVLSASDTLIVEVVMRNAGEREGSEVVQLYVRDEVSSVSTPVQQLKAFAKVSIEKGSRARVSLRLPISELALYDADMNHVVEPGTFEIQVGHSSNDIAFRRKLIVEN